MNALTIVLGIVQLVLSAGQLALAFARHQREEQAARKRKQLPPAT